jgi:hypothetical protein
MLPWTIDWPEYASAAKAAAAPELVELAETYAAASMRTLTLDRIGGLPRTVMPTGRTCTSPHMRRDMFYPTAFFPSALSLKACGCILGCGCSDIGGVQLEAPVGDIIEVRLEGAVLDPSEYRVEDGNRLVRTTGAWPVCAGRNFTVTYLNGYKVDAMGAYAGGVLAAEFLFALTSDKKCRLSAKASAVSRQGINMELTPGLFPEGTTGLTEVDAYLRLWNPNGIKQAPRVYSIDAPRQREVTWGVY